METFPPRVEAYGLGSAVRTRSTSDHPSRTNPDVRSPFAYLRWLMGQQRHLVIGNAAANTINMMANAVMPLVLGLAIDQGIRPGNMSVTWAWAGVLVLCGVVGAISGVTSHTITVAGWLAAMYRTIGLVARRSLSLGHVLPRRTPTGEVLSVTGGDSDNFGAFHEVFSRFIGAVISFLFVSILVLRQSLSLGLVVLIAAPLMVGAAAPFLRPLQRARTRERTRASKLTGMATDIVAGLRILRGIGGEHTFGENYRKQSQRVRRAGVVAGTWQAAVDALAVLISGWMLVLLTYLGTRAVLAGELTVGQLVSFFGYAVFLVWPVSTMFEFAQKMIQSMVSAKKTVVVLGQSAPWKATENPEQMPQDAVIRDEVSGFEAHPNRLTVVVSSVPDDSAALADRVGRYLTGSEEPISYEIDESLRGSAARAARAEKAEELAALARRDAEAAARPWGVTFDGVDAGRFDLAEFRHRVMVSDASSMLFAGTLQELIDPHGRATREQAEAAMRTASAEDVYDTLPQGWQGRIDERGRGLSGGQRQRLVLARALVADPEVLVLVEPTSAVDAHTEARIAERLAEARRGRTTIVTTVSPLILHHADEVVFMQDGQCLARGTHEHLLATEPGYRAVVDRGSEDEQEQTAAEQFDHEVEVLTAQTQAEQQLLQHIGKEP